MMSDEDYLDGMMPDPQTPPDAHPFDLPPYLKRFYEWAKVVLLLVGIVAAAAGIFFHEDAAWFLGCVSIGFLIVLYFVTVFTRRLLQANRLADTILSTGAYAKLDERDRARRELKKARTTAQLVIVSLAFVTVASLGSLLYQPMYYKFRTERPRTMEFQSVRYFDPTRDLYLVRQSPFLEAVVAYLKSEGDAEGRNTRIVLATTKAFLRPTPVFLVSISVDDQTEVVDGYAFREHRIREHVFYEPVTMNYAQQGSIGFLLPPCDPGDNLFFLGRLSLKNQKESFPSNLQGVFTLSASEVH